MSISAKDWRTIRLALLVLTPLLLYSKGVVPFRAKLADLRTRAKVERETLIRERNAVETARRNPELQVATDSAFRALEPRLFEGRDDAMAASEVQNYIKDLAYQNQVYVLPETRGGQAVQLVDGVRALRVELRAESDLQGFLEFLRDLETGDKLITVERLDITRSSRSGGGGTAATDGMEKLSMTATITGYGLGDLTTKSNDRSRAPVTGAARGGSARGMN